jgi:hypothetical protein
MKADLFDLMDRLIVGEFCLDKISESSREL